MATKTSATNRLPKGRAVSQAPLLVHRIHTLLHTMRCIAQYEDELCTLLHAAERGNTLEPEWEDELRSLIEAMPAHEYADDLGSLRAALPGTSRKPSGTSEGGSASKTKAASKSKAASNSRSRSKPSQSRARR